MFPGTITAPCPSHSSQFNEHSNTFNFSKIYSKNSQDHKHSTVSYDITANNCNTNTYQIMNLERMDCKDF